MNVICNCFIDLLTFHISDTASGTQNNQQSEGNTLSTEQVSRITAQKCNAYLAIDGSVQSHQRGMSSSSGI